MKRSALLLPLVGFALVACQQDAPIESTSTEISTAFETREVAYQIEGTTFRSVAVWPQAVDASLPGVLMVPNWMGPTEASLEKARKIAAKGRVVFMVDMYGEDVRPQNGSEAAEAAGFVRADRELVRARAAEAHRQLLAFEEAPLDGERLAAIGFCFGGGTVLEYARSGADLAAVVSFHGDLLSPTLAADSANIGARVLVLHGADDPYVPQDHVQTFVSTMQETEADWQLVQFSNTVHSFTDPLAKAPGAAEYNPLSAKRAFEMMDDLFAEIF
jgi:dienelactone hydrolase